MTGDSFKKSSTETAIQMIGGYLIGVGINYLIFPMLGITSTATIWSVSLLYTAASYVRGLIIRRIFNSLSPDWSFSNLIHKVKS